VAGLVVVPLLAATAYGATTPPAPTGLTATTPTRLAHVLHWNAVADATGGYRVFRGGAQIGTSSTTSYTDTGLRSSGSYVYTVKTVRLPNKISGASAPVTVVYDVLAPGTVGTLSGKSTATAPSLTWSPVTDTGGSGLRRYDVRRDGTLIGTPTTASFSDGSVTADGSYSYSVQAEDWAGNLGTASPALNVIVDRTAPSVPPAPTAAATVTGSAPQLSWPASSDAGTGVTGYQVMRNGVRVATVAQTSFTDSALSTSGIYSYTVVAVDGVANASAASPATSVDYDVTPPPAPTGLAADSSPTDAPPSLTWNAVVDSPPGPVTYRVTRDGQTIAAVDTTSYVDAPAGDGSHRYTVTAIDQLGNSSAPSAALTVVVDTVAPSTPLGVFAESTGGTTTVSWAAAADAGTGVGSYSVLRDGSPVATVPGTLFSEPADAGSTYRVIAVDRADNASSPSLPATAGAAFPTGVSSRLVIDTSADEKTQYPSLPIVSVMLFWNQVEPSLGVYHWGNLDASLADARDRGYRLIVRVMCGADAPTWMAGDPDHPVSYLDLLSNEPTNARHSGEMLVPVQWDPNLAWHYGNLMSALNDHLSGSDGAGGSWADHVEFVPVAMPTMIGTEMQTGYGAGSYTGTYKGVYGTYDRGVVNRAEWDAHAVSGTTSADRQLSNRSSLEAAWRDAIAIQMARLTSVPSAVAYGALLNDGYAAAQRLVSSEVARYGDRLWAMTTNLQPKVRADGTLGPYSEWSPAASQTITLALQQGGVVGFQTAGNGSISTAAQMREVIDDGIGNYNMRFLETQPETIDLYPGQLLTDTDSARARLQARFAG
jgi:fibronectin type 3 domain-containing protein